MVQPATPRSLLMLERQTFLLTRPQVDVLAKSLLEAAKKMPKPS
jgi:hypothetical protein